MEYPEQQMVPAQRESIDFYLGETVVRIRARTLGSLLWENAPLAELAGWLDVLGRPLTYGVFRKVAKRIGIDPPGKRDDLAAWAVTALITIILSGLMTHDWQLQEEQGINESHEHESGDSWRVYRVCGITSRADPAFDSPPTNDSVVGAQVPTA